MKRACLLLFCSVWSGTVLLLSIAQKFDSNWIIQKKQRSASSGYEGDETWHKDSGSFDRSNDETKAKKQVVLPEVGIPFYVTPFPHKMLSPRVNDGDQHATLPPEIKQVLTLVSEDKPVTPPTVSDVVVLCGESDMVVKVKKRFFGFGCTASQLTLGYSYECQSNGVDRETGDLVFTYSYSACGSKRSMPDGLVIYQNVLRYVPNRRRSSIRRAHPVNIEIECRYPRYHHLYKLVFRPTWYPPAGIRTLKQFGFDLIPMNSVWTKGSLSNVYQLGQAIPFQVRGYLRNPGQKLFIHSCHATASPDPKSTPQYSVIDNYGCMVDSKTEACNSSFVPPRTLDTINFVVDAFQFNVKPSSKIYLHCVLFIANSPLVTPGAKSCTYNRIEERWEELEGFNSVCTCCNSKCAGGALEPLSEVEFEVRVPITPQVALHGRYAVLECRFTVEGDLNLDRSVLTWQRGSEVVHSFYYVQDQLEKQSPRYWNRTSLYLSELKRGNASLKLEGVGPEDAGEYTCSVSTLLGSQRKTFSLIFAALYAEPLLRIKVNPHNVTSSLQSEGYPDSTVQWLDGEGQDISILSQTVSQRNAEGLYTVTSTLSTVRSSNTTLTFILKNRELNQHITRTFSLLPEDAPVDDNPAGMRWAPVLSVVVLAVLCVLALTIYFKTWKKTTAKSIEHLENGKLMRS